MRRSRKIPAWQDALPFQDREARGILAYALPWERRLVGALCASFLLLGAGYVYFVTSSILHVAARQELAGKVVAAKAAVSSLETSYFDKTRAITESYARAAGYVAIADQTFVARDTALTLHDTH